MNDKNPLYFSEILGARLLEEAGGSPGRIADLYVDVGQPRPRVVAAAVVSGRPGRRSRRIVDFSDCRIARMDGHRIVITQNIRDKVLPGENLLSLRKHLLDRQIVDVDGRKLVRVNDLVLEEVQNAVFLVAVDVGTEGLLRRLGVAGILNACLKPLGRSLPGKLILWAEVEAVDFSSTKIKLSRAYSKLGTFHPSELADILEDLDRKSQLALFSSLDEERAADVLEELEPGAQVGLLESLSDEKAADVLEKMPADEVADILDELKREKAERLLAEMETESSAEVRNLMRYAEDSVGSLMSTDYIFFSEYLTVGDALLELRKLKPEAEAIYYVYVLDARGRYLGTISLRDIVVSEPATRLGSIMSSEVAPLRDVEDIRAIGDLLLKYKLHAVPVVNEETRMVGTIVIEDVLELAMRGRH